MKKLAIILLSVILVLGGFAFGWAYTGHSFSFFENYYTNFTENVMNLRILHERNKAEREERLSSNNGGEEETAPADTADAPSPSASPSPETEKKNEINFRDTSSLPRSFELSCDPIAINGAANGRFERFGNSFLYVGENVMICYDTAGKMLWQIPLQLSSPVLKVSGGLILLFEEGGKKIVLFNNKKTLFSAETEDPILNGYLSPEGDCVIITDKQFYKGNVLVYSRSGDIIYDHAFGKENVISAALYGSRTLAVSLLAADEELVSKIAFYDIRSDEGKPESTLEYPGSVIFMTEFSKNILFAYADDRLIALSSSGRELWQDTFDSKTLSYVRRDKNDIRLLMFDNNNNSELSLVTASGKEKKKIHTDTIPNSCDIYNGYIIYSSGRNIFLTRSNGAPLAKYTSSRDIRKAYFIDSDNILVVYNSSIELIHTKRGQRS